MKIQCEQCKIEYNIDDAAIGERGIRAQCPRCNFITTIRKSQPAILDQARAKLDTAICVNCGKPTEPIPGDPIPICPACQAQSIDIGSKTTVSAGVQLPPAPARQPITPPAHASAPPAPMGSTPVPGFGGGAPVPSPIGVPPPVYEPSAAPDAGGQWRIKKSPGGEVYGPFDRDLITGWIEGDKIVPADEISRVGGPWKPAAEHEDFAPLFAARLGAVGGAANGAAVAEPPLPVEVRKTITGGTGGRIVSPKVQTREPPPWKALLAGAAALVVVGAAAAVWYTGAMASITARLRRDPPPPPYDLTDKMIDAVRAEYPEVAGTAAQHVEAARAAAAPDTVQAWSLAAAEFKQALALERTNVDALAGLAEMSALLATYDQQTNLLDESLRFAVRATEWDGGSVHAARARAAALIASGPQNAAEARALLETKVLPAAPDDPVALTMLGRAWAPADAAKAESFLTQAVGKSGTLQRPRVELGILYEGSHRYQRALDTFKPIVDKSFLAAYRTGKIDEKVGAYREAGVAYKLAAQIAEPAGGRPWADAVISYAVIQYQALGNVKEASRALAPLEARFLAPDAAEKLRKDQMNRLRLHLAILARMTGQYERSLELSRRVLAERDIEHSAAASFNIGLTGLRKGDLAEADRALDEADVPGLDDRVQSEIYLWHGLVKHRRGEIPAAESAFEDAKKEDGQNWRAIVAHALLLGESGERNIEAMAKMQDLATVDPGFYEQYQRVTLFYPDSSNELIANAQRVFARIHATTHGTDARSSTAQGILAYLSGNRAKAALHVKDALEEANPDPAAFVFAGLLAEARGGRGDLDQAVERLTTAKSAAPSAFLSTAIGRVEVQRGDYAKAMSDLQDALNRNPNYAPAHYWLGVCYQKKGDTRQAIAKWTDALKYDPNYVRASRAIFDLDGHTS